MLTQYNMLIFFSLHWWWKWWKTCGFLSTTNTLCLTFLCLSNRTFKRPTKLLASDSDFTPILKYSVFIEWSSFVRCQAKFSDHFYELQFSLWQLKIKIYAHMSIPVHNKNGQSRETGNICVGHHSMQANTNNLNKTWTSYKQHKLPGFLIKAMLEGKNR
jgi:hypothetical protein